MKKWKVGDIVAVTLPSGKIVRGWILYLSEYFKDVIGTVFPIYGGARQIQYTNIKAALSYGWEIVDFREPNANDLALTARIVGGSVFVGDTMVRHASPDDLQKLPAMLVKGMPIIFEDLEIQFHVE